MQNIAGSCGPSKDFTLKSLEIKNKNCGYSQITNMGDSGT
jgi:hypothetical protein